MFLFPTSALNRFWELRISLVHLCRRLISVTGVSGCIQNCLCTPPDKHLTNRGNKVLWWVAWLCGRTKTCIECSGAPQNLPSHKIHGSDWLVVPGYSLLTCFGQVFFRQNNIYFILHISIATTISSGDDMSMALLYKKHISLHEGYKTSYWKKMKAK